MSARVSYWDGVESAYAAAQAWVDLGLRKDDSLFTPGKSIWTRELLGELHRRFLDRPDDSRRPFLDKLEDQLSGSPAEVHQLMGEVLYVHYLLLHPNEQALRRVLGWSSPPVDIPPELVDGLRFQFINIGGDGHRTVTLFLVCQVGYAWCYGHGLDPPRLPHSNRRRP